MRWPVGFLLSVLFMFQIIHVDFVAGGRLTIEVDSGREDCFYIAANESQSMTLEYAVIAVTHGPLTINFQLVDPKGRPLLTEFRKSRASHVIKLPSAGTYACCFDNTFASFSMKHVSFTWGLDVDKSKPTWNKYIGELVPEGDYGVQVKDIEMAIDRVRVSLDNIKRVQDMYRDMETIDRGTAESNFERVNNWSLLNCTIMLVVGAVQVVMLKSLFDDKYNIFKNVKKFTQ